MLLRREGQPGADEGSAREGHALSRSGRPGLPLDVLVVPSLLLLTARDLLLHDPPRVLAWRLLHEARLAELPGWLAALAPGGGAFDRDPVALLLAAACAGVAVAYLAAGIARAGLRLRAALLALGAAFAVVLPTVAVMAMGWALDRPYGQDGGVVQLPLAIERLLRGESPYGADYSASMLGRQARVSPFWQAYGGNPLLRHHAYLPGTHLLMLPGYALCRLAGAAFDARLVTLAAWVAAALLAARLAGRSRALAAAAVVLVGPLVYWPQVFGANDVLQAALLLLAVLLAQRGAPVWSGAVLGLACASKQLAWPFAPFMLAHLSGARSLGELLRGPAWRRLGPPALAAAAVFAAVVAPVAALDPRAFWQDIVVYNVGLPAADSYPLGGTPGFGFANFLIYFGRVGSLRDAVSFAPFYALLAPLGLLLLRRQLQHGHAAAALVSGSVALLASVYFSRVVHPNYLVPAAILLPVGLLAAAGAEDRGRRPWGAEVAVVPLSLLAVAVEVVEHELLASVWHDAVAARVPAHATGWVAALLPRAGPTLTADPLGLLFGAVAAGLAVLWLAAAVLGAGWKAKASLAALALALVVAAPAAVVAAVGEATGIPRAQEAWFAALSDTARRASGRSAPPPVREAWSQSFRRDPPAAVPAEQSLGATAPALGRLLGGLGATDPRMAMVAALALSALMAAAAARARHRPLALAVAALAPPAVVGAIFGSPEALALAFVAGALLLAPRHAVASAVALGVGAGLFPRLLWAAPLLLAARGAPRAPGRALRPPYAFAAAFGLTLGLALALAGAHGGLPALRPGLGLPNLALYAGMTGSSPWPWLALAAAVLGAAVLRARAAAPAQPLHREAALFLLAGLWLLPGASPHDLVVPLFLLVWPALEEDGSAEGPGAQTGPASPGA